MLLASAIGLVAAMAFGTGYVLLAKYIIIGWMHLSAWIGHQPNFDLMAGAAIACAMLITMIAYLTFYDIGKQIEHELRMAWLGW